MNTSKHKLLAVLSLCADWLLCALCACCYMLLTKVSVLLLLPALAVFTLINIFPIYPKVKALNTRLSFLFHGYVCLMSFVGSVVLSAAYHIYLAVKLLPDYWTSLLFSAVICALLLGVLFWNGMICVFATSVQLGIKIRVIALICGFVPVANVIVLLFMLRTISREIKVESEKNSLNESRRDEQVCKTKYPVLFVHGVFFRDFKALNYWGRIPEELKKNGAEIYYGNHQSASGVADSGEELTARIKNICETTGCGKVNVIAHSKGGLDIRYAAAKCGADEYIASITTINTPHRGCEFADYLLNKIGTGVQTKVAAAYNSAAQVLGDKSPDFLVAVRDLTAANTAEINASLEEAERGQGERILRRSFGSKLNRAKSGKFPLNFSYHLVNHFDGANDGLVGEKSFEWGEEYSFLKVNGKRGISHADMIDLNRENIPGFDVREFYVNLVRSLKEKGL